MELKPPVLIVDFLHGGVGDDGIGIVILSKKGGRPDELKTHIDQLLDWQHVKLQDGMKVWLVDLDRDVSGKDGAPLSAIVRWHDDQGWRAEYLGADAESL